MAEEDPGGAVDEAGRGPGRSRGSAAASRVIQARLANPMVRKADAPRKSFDHGRKTEIGALTRHVDDTALFFHPEHIRFQP